MRIEVAHCGELTVNHLFLGLVFLLLLSACSATKVHLFTQGVEASELNQISETLQQQGFRVNLVELQPPDLPNATIIYSPALPNIDDVARISTSLAEFGYNNIELIAVSKDNQSYTGRNVGLYLSGPDANMQVDQNEQPMPFEYAGHCDASDAYLNLQPNGSFDLKIISWDESDKEHTKVLSGQWKAQDAWLELILNKSAASKFQIIKSERTDEQSLYTKTQLTSTQETGKLAGCRFTASIISGK